MLHRYIYGVLQDGVQAFVDNPSLLDDLFRWEYNLEDEEIHTIKEYFAKYPPNVATGYMRRDSKFPCITIVLGGETEAEQVMDRYMGRVDPDDPMTEHDGEEIAGSIWQYVFHVFVYTEHPDVTEYYYEVVKSILQLAHEQLTDYGVFDIVLSGMDLAPDIQYLPEHLFVRQLQIQCKRENHHVLANSLVGRAFKIAGVHVDKSGSPRDAGEVKTLVTVRTVDPGGA